MRGRTRLFEGRGAGPSKGATPPRSAGSRIGRDALPSEQIDPLYFSLSRGPYQNNGASPWYAYVPVGSNNQVMKLALDSGGNFLWTTSTLCGPTGCVHYGNEQFDINASSTFQLVPDSQQQVDFGPWGSMEVQVGSDELALPNGARLRQTFFVSNAYGGEQFAELDWDGGLALPSGSSYADPSTSFLVADLMNAGLIDPTLPYVQFTTDAASGTGQAIVGGYDFSHLDPNDYIYMPWSGYTEFTGVEYIWSTPLADWSVGGQSLAQNIWFCLDSGSSQFKGDDNLMNGTLAAVGAAPNVDVYLALGTNGAGQQGGILVPPSVYDVTIQAGPGEGQTLPQFNPLGLTDLALVGSVLMDQFATVYVYDVTDVFGQYVLQPLGMYLFAKTAGAKLMTQSTKKCKAAPLGRRPFKRITATGGGAR